MIEKEQWSPNNSPILSGMEIRIWYHPKPITVSELKVTLEKIWDNCPQLQLIKLSQVLQVVWQEYVNG